MDERLTGCSSKGLLSKAFCMLGTILKMQLIETTNNIMLTALVIDILSRVLACFFSVVKLAWFKMF